MRYVLPAALLALTPFVAEAHAFGQQFALPLPVNLYIFGGVAAFVISCAFLSLVGHVGTGKERVYVLPKHAWNAVEIGLQTILLILLLAGLGFGIFGSRSAFFNPLPYFFWIGLVLIVPYVSVLIAGLWEVGNPFRTLLSLVSWPLPEGKKVWRHGYVPAAVLYVGLIVLELFFSNISTQPRVLAGFIIAYALFLIIGSYRYGARDWFRYADMFTVFMRLAGKLSPLRLTEGKLVIASPVTRLVTEAPTRFSLVAFVLFALAATAYDGFRETKLVLDLILNVLQTPWTLTQFGIFALFPVAFFLLYIGTIAAMKWLVKGTASVGSYALRFAYSLVPIMVAYHFAHYFSLMLNTLGIVIGADIVWYVQLGTIVLGHAFAAYVAHQIALLEFTTKKKAFVSQIPLVLLMVFYTAFGLWILAQPFAG